MRVDWCVSSWFRIKNTHSLALPSGRNSDPAALAGGGAGILYALSPQRLSVLAVPLRGVLDHHPRLEKVKDHALRVADPQLPIRSWVARPTLSSGFSTPIVRHGTP